MHNFKKSLGQNFLKDNSVIDNICGLFDVDKDSVIVEVGPGDGALTRHLILKESDVLCFEIDESLKVYLDKINSDNLTVVYKDFLSINLKDYINNYKKIYFVSNVPYYITTPIINKFINSNIIPDIMIMMVQKEVAERLSAKPGTKEYGAISVLLNYFYDIEYAFTVDRTSFYPIPKVDSAVIKFNKNNNIYLKDYSKFEKIVYDAFKHKRKNLKNNLSNYDLIKVEEILSKYKLELTCRAEEVSYEVFVDLANNL